MPGMKRTLQIGWLLTLLLCAGITHRAAADGADDPPGGVKRALLVGINRYKAVPGLQGSVNDVETMREILITRWGFQPRNITMLTDENATRDRILSNLVELVRVSGPQDTLYFHFSGHGSQVQDLNGDEDDGLDETIVPQDGRSGDVKDIVDDELDAIFSKLRARSTLIVLDSCHSGTATRALDIRARSVPQDMRIDLYRTGVTGTSTRGIQPIKRSRFVVMGGAADNEEALDGPVEGTYHGFFTYALSRSMTAAGSNASPKEIFAGVTRELGRIQATFGRTSMPEPQLEGPPDALDRPLFASLDTTGGGAAGSSAPGPTTAPTTEIPRLAWLNVHPAASGQVTLLNGLLLGATPGSTWAIYPHGEKQFGAGRAVAVATVTSLVGKDAEAKLLNQNGPIEPESRAVALMPAPASARIAIRILDVPADQRSRIEEILKHNIKNLSLVGPDKSARFLVDMQGQTVRLLTADGLRVVGSFSPNDAGSAADVGRVASRSAKAAELLTLDNPSSQLKVSARIAGGDPMATRDIKLIADTSAAQLHSRRQGEPRSTQNSLQLEIGVNSDAFITIVDVDSEGNMNVLFPNDYQHTDFHPDGAVRAGAPVMIPDSLQTGNRAGFYWDYSPPRGTDTVRVFASSDLATATTIRQRIKSLQQAAGQTRGNPGTRGIGADNGGSGANSRSIGADSGGTGGDTQGSGADSRGSSGDLGALREDLGKLATRGISVVSDQSAGTAPSAAGGATAGVPADWAATSITVQVDD
jgi:hypothetical protein